MRSCPHCLSPYSAQIEFCGIDGTRLAEFEFDPLVGRDLDRYRILGTIGNGAMARVYRARHKVLDREYAVKVLFGEIASDKNLAERFRREAQVISKMSHPNVVTVIDFGTSAEGLTFLTMELVAGRTLRDAIKREAPFAPERALVIARQVTAGLAEAHLRGFVHRDLKPGNIMLVPERDTELVKILDFGLVRAADVESEEGSLTRTGQFLGTPIYMAPEQIIGGEVTPAADIYSLGIVLFEMLEGTPPFRGKKLAEIRQKHVMEPPPPVRPSLGLEVLIAELLSKDPIHRPPSAEAVIARLDALDPERTGAGESRPPTHIFSDSPVQEVTLRTEISAVARQLANLVDQDGAAFPVVPAPAPLHAAGTTTPLVQPETARVPAAALGSSPFRSGARAELDLGAASASMYASRASYAGRGRASAASHRAPEVDARGAAPAVTAPMTSPPTAPTAEVGAAEDVGVDSIPPRLASSISSLEVGESSQVEDADLGSLILVRGRQRAFGAAIAGIGSVLAVGLVLATVRTIGSHDPGQRPAPAVAATAPRQERGGLVRGGAAPSRPTPATAGAPAVAPRDPAPVPSVAEVAPVAAGAAAPAAPLPEHPHARREAAPTAGAALSGGRAAFEGRVHASDRTAELEPRSVRSTPVARAAVASDPDDDVEREDRAESRGSGGISGRRWRQSVREVEQGLQHEIARRGLGMEELALLDAVGPKLERWRSARTSHNLATLNAAAAALAQAVRAAPINQAVVLKRLDQVHRRLQDASSSVGVAVLTPLEDRYLDLAKSVTPRTPEDECSALLLKASTLLRDISAAEHARAGR